MKWISVKEKLPMELLWVLVYSKDERPDIAYFFNNRWHSVTDPTAHLENVTHWLEIEPPKEGGIK